MFRISTRAPVLASACSITFDTRNLWNVCERARKDPVIARTASATTIIATTGRLILCASIPFPSLHGGRGCSPLSKGLPHRYEVLRCPKPWNRTQISSHVEPYGADRSVITQANPHGV